MVRSRYDVHCHRSLRTWKERATDRNNFDPFGLRHLSSTYGGVKRNEVTNEMAEDIARSEGDELKRERPGAWSYSALKQFEQCPKRYKIERITKEIESKVTFALRWGNEVHKYIENRIKRIAPLPDFLEYMEPILAAFENAGYVCRAEVGFGFNTRLEPRPFDHPETWARGYIDFLAISPQLDHAYIFDWKTGKRRPDAGQLELYALALSSLGIYNTRTAFIWLASNTADKYVVRPEHLPFIFNRFKARVSRLDDAWRNGNWPAKPSALCGWCPAVSRCEEGRTYRDKGQTVEREENARISDYVGETRKWMQERGGREGSSEGHTNLLLSALQQVNLVDDAG